MISVRFSDAAREAPRFTAVVVLPTPPFWLAMAMTRAKSSPSEGGNVAEILRMCKMFHVERFV